MENTIKIRDLELKAIQELREEDERLAINELKGRLKEIDRTRKLLNKLEKQYRELLDKEIEGDYHVEL